MLIVIGSKSTTIMQPVMRTRHSRGALLGRNKTSIELVKLIKNSTLMIVVIVAILLLKLPPTTCSQVDFMASGLRSPTDYQTALQSAGFELADDNDDDADEFSKIMASTNKWLPPRTNDNLKADSNDNNNNNLMMTAQDQQQDPSADSMHDQSNRDRGQSASGDSIATIGNQLPLFGPTNNGNNTDSQGWSVVETSGERNQRASIVQTEFGDHAEPSELENQFSSMLGGNNHNNNNSNNQSATIGSLSSDKYDVATIITTSTSKATGNNKAERSGSSTVPLEESRWQNYTQSDGNSTQILHQQRQTNSTASKQQQQQEANDNRIRLYTKKRRRKQRPKHKLKHVQLSSDQTLFGQQDNNLDGGGHSTMINYVSQKQQQQQRAQLVQGQPDWARFQDWQAYQQQQRNLNPLEYLQLNGRDLRDSYSLLPNNREPLASDIRSLLFGQKQNHHIPATLNGVLNYSKIGDNNNQRSVETALTSLGNLETIQSSKPTKGEQQVGHESTTHQQQQLRHPGSSSSTDLRGPFELEQLQATASNLRSNKIHTLPSSGHHQYHLVGASDLIGTSSSSLASEKNKVGANSELTIAPTEGDPPALANNLVPLESESEDESDYDSDEPSQSDDAADGVTSQANGMTDENSGTAAIHEHSQRHSPPEEQQQQRQQHKAADEPATQAPSEKAANQTALSGESQDAASTRPAANRVNKQHVPEETSLSRIVMRSQGQPQVGNNELLVGPFKSEAEAPATITLAGVIYQKSGASSALIRTSSRHLLKTTPIDSSGSRYSKGQEQQSSSGSGPEPESNRPIQAVTTTGDRLVALGDLPTSLQQSSSSPIQNSLLTLQQGSPIYLDPLRASGSGGGDVPATGVNFLHQAAPTSSLDGDGSGGNALQGGGTLSSDQQQAALIRFSSYLSGLSSGVLGSNPIPSSSSGSSSSLLSSLAGGGQLSFLPQAGEQLSLSSSNSKPTTTSTNKSFASHLMMATANKDTQGKGRLTALTPGASLSTANFLYPSSGLLPQLDQYQQERLLMSQLTGGGGGGLGSSGSSYKRLPGGTTIWTIGGARSPPSVEMAALSSSSSQHSQLDGEPSQMSESKAHQTGGPIVIVQKDVKPVKYHLLRAYLKLRRLLRPFEATYVFPSEPNVSGAGSVGAASSILGRRRRLSRFRRTGHEVAPI